MSFMYFSRLSLMFVSFPTLEKGLEEPGLLKINLHTPNTGMCDKFSFVALQFKNNKIEGLPCHGKKTFVLRKVLERNAT